MNRLLDPEQFQAWKANPLTQDYLAYLADRRSNLMEAWASGQWGADKVELQAQAVLLGTLAELSFEMIEDQYRKPEPEAEPEE
mgnify:CR=1 FL=1